MCERANRTLHFVEITAAWCKLWVQQDLITPAMNATSKHVYLCGQGSSSSNGNLRGVSTSSTWLSPRRYLQKGQGGHFERGGIGGSGADSILLRERGRTSSSQQRGQKLNQRVKQLGIPLALHRISIASVVSSKVRWLRTGSVRIDDMLTKSLDGPKFKDNEEACWPEGSDRWREAWDSSATWWRASGSVEDLRVTIGSGARAGPSFSLAPGRGGLRHSQGVGVPQKLEQGGMFDDCC